MYKTKHKKAEEVDIIPSIRELIAFLGFGFALFSTVVLVDVFPFQFRAFLSLLGVFLGGVMLLENSGGVDRG